LSDESTKKEESSIERVLSLQKTEVENLANGLVVMLNKGVIAVSLLDDVSVVEVNLTAAARVAAEVQQPLDDLRNALGVFIKIAKECLIPDAPEQVFGLENTDKTNMIVDVMKTSGLMATLLVKLVRKQPYRNLRIHHFTYVNDRAKVTTDMFRLEFVYRTEARKVSTAAFELDRQEMKRLIQELSGAIQSK